MPEFKPVRFGKYLLMERLATGGMAQLFRAKIIGVQGFEKFVAIKQILPHLAEEKELVSSFIDEAKLAALLNHQNVVQIYDFGDVEDSYFITMEYLFGKDLRIIANKSKEKGFPLRLEHCLYITSRICSGLDYAHKLKDFQGKPLNIIHRDISPQNVIITYEGDVKIVDFGIAKARSQSTVTQVGMIKGKVAYMSPEQAAGKAIDHRSDIFPTGILLYEMLSGKRMFTGDTLQILAKVRRAEFPSPEEAIGDLPPKLHQILHRALAKEPEERYQSCGEMLADLEECMAELNLRPTTRGLAQDMKELFKEDIAAEEQGVREAAEAAAVPIPVPEEIRPAREVPAAERTAEKPVEKPAVKVEEAAAQKTKKRGFLYGAAAVVAVVVIGGAIAFWPTTKPVTTPDKGAQVPPAQPPATPPSAETGAGKVPPADSAKTVGKVSESSARAKALQNEASGVLDTHPEKAKALLTEATTLDPNNFQSQFQLGVVHAKLGDFPKAIESYNKVVELNPQFPDVFFNLGYIYAKRKEYAKAEEMYGRVVQLAPSYLDEALFNLGMVQERQGKKTQSIENVERAIKVNPNNELAKKFLNKLKGKS
jgi:tetratricopeptide (TPR) repeat protein